MAKHPDELRCVALAVRRSVGTALAQARQFGVHQVAVADELAANSPEAQELRAWCEAGGGFLRFGVQAVEELCLLPDVDVVVNALVGAAGLRASYLTLEAGRVLALANKESLVVGGDLLMPLAARLNGLRGDNGALMPIDSEHGAIYQCLLGEDMAEVTKLWVTASGGPFRGRTREQLTGITPAQALAHPTWNMGAKTPSIPPPS